MQMFLQNLCLRPSCYACAFKKKNRVSDITLADFWGCDSVCPELDDDKGLSLVLCHSIMGRTVFKAIEGKIVMEPVSLEKALYGNPSLVKSCKKPEQRDAFMMQMDSLMIPQLAQGYLKKPSLSSYIKQLIPMPLKRTLKRFLKR